MARISRINDPIFTAADHLAYRRQMGTAPNFSPPAAVIFCFQPDLLSHAVKRWRGQKMAGFFGDFYLLKKTGRRIGIIGDFGVGAPVTAVLLEELAAFGVGRFVSLGMAGGLQETVKAGDLVVANRAIRDEGTSRHYAPPAKYAWPAAELTRCLEQRLDNADHLFTRGTTWTTDAPYREMRGDVIKYQKEGVLTVEMETAAFFTVAHHLQVEAAAAFAIGDSLQNGRWRLDFNREKTRQGLRTLVNAAVRCLL